MTTPRERLIQLLERERAEAGMHDAPLPEITCDKCIAKDHCRSRYDRYNTDGDCLEEK